MSLPRLLQRKRLTVLGLNAGTSADGLDLAVIVIDRSRRGYQTRFLAGRMRQYPPELRRMVLRQADSESTSLDDLIRFDQALGMFYGRAAATFIRYLQKREVRVDVVASHGQTVRHLPHPKRLAGQAVRGSLQLGNLEQIAVLTGRVAVGDFRQADIALGGEGAPITAAAMQRLFGAVDDSRLIVNIGGTANYFYFPSRSSDLAAAAADCGPGNSLSDILCQELFREPYDRGGRRARKGQVCQRLLSLLRREPFYENRTLSTGREAFGPELAARIIALGRKLRLSPGDTLATAAELTVVSIAGSIGTFVERDRRLRKLYLTGGGAHNKFFTHRLQALLDPVQVGSITALGFNPDQVEASAYAVMGEACLRSDGLPTRFGHTTRSGRTPVLGRIAQPPRER